MKTIRPSVLLASASWGSVFTEGWLLLTGVITASGLAWGLFILFFLVALIASAVASDRKSAIGELVVKIDDELYSVDNGNLIISPGSPGGKTVLLLSKKQKGRTS